MEEVEEEDVGEESDDEWWSDDDDWGDEQYVRLKFRRQKLFYLCVQCIGLKSGKLP